MLSPLYQGMTCQPPSIFTKMNTCTQGGYPVYVVNATNVADIQAAVNFARNTGIRLVIKNTGHDFAGKSGGAGSLSIWTHHLKELAFLPDYSSSEYTGPAIKAGVGIQGYELYAAADKFGVVAMGGECPTVGVTGGWIQGGGHSPMSSLWGMGADQALGFEVVTSDGQFVTANKDTNADLYWALRGGGGGNFGVVTSVIMKVHRDVPVTSASWTFATGDNVTAQQFKAGMKAFFETFPDGADNGIYAYFSVFYIAGAMTFSMAPYFAADKNMTEAKALLAPWVAQMEDLKVPLDIDWQEFGSFYAAYNHSFPVEAVNNQGVATASRMFPRENWANETIWNATYNALWSSLEAGNALIGYNIAPSWERGGYTDAAVSPAWRNTIGFIITGIVTDMTQPWAEQLRQRQNFTDTIMQGWRDLTPGSGAYLSEADRLEPNFQWAFWGSFYMKLLEMKKKYDPYNLFYAAQSVGSEFFEVRTLDNGYPDENGKLCVNPRPMQYLAEGPGKQ
jgi:FAD/FMN-containing dehydrogenase